mmetsp:Transcript_29434/g.61856  ORF Transcript_29434/g.61856 Transcript_29434/m.61856 type:complete len:354 (+) Transcript_29434:314-1375(+)
MRVGTTAKKLPARSVATVQLRLQADAKKPRPQNVKGTIFVDESCIDCDTCRWLAPDTFGRADGKSYVHSQPKSSSSTMLTALAALVACPTGSIRTSEPVPLMRDVAATGFPLAVDAKRIPNVFYLGYHSAASFGATPYLVRCPECAFNVMVDSPRYNSKLAARLEELGGVDLMLLTHMDDVADHNRWAERFPKMRRLMHATDVRGPDSWPHIDMRNVEIQVAGDGPWHPVAGIEVVHTPGHSRGSLSFLVDGRLSGGESVLFTGDHLALSGRLGRLDGFARYGHDLALQAKSIDKLADLDFLWILPGHGRSMHFGSAEARREAVAQCAEDFARDPFGKHVANRPLYVEPVRAA